MATQEEFDRLQAAFAKADAAVDADPNDTEALEDARAFSAEIRRLTGQAGAQPQAQAAPQQEDGFLARAGRSISDAMVGSITTSKAVAQGLPGIGTWTDELAGQAISAIHGGDAEQARKDYMAPVEAMPAGRRLAAELVGGVVGSAPLAGLGLPASLAAATGLGAASGAGANESDRAKGATAGGITGLAAGVLAPAIGGAASSIGSRVANVARSIMGKPTNPFVGGGSGAAQRTMRESIDNAKRAGFEAPTTDAPLLAQPAGVPAARRVLNRGETAAADLVGAARGAADESRAVLADTAGKVGGIADQSDLLAEASLASSRGGLKMRGAQLAAEGDAAISSAESNLSGIGQRLAKSGQQRIAEVAQKIAGTGQNIGREGVREAGKAYQDLGIVPVGLRTTPEEVLASPIVSSNAIGSLLKNPDVEKIVAGMQKDVRFTGVPTNNLTFLNELTIQLGNAAKGLRSVVPVKATRMDALRAQFMDAMEAAVPGYKGAAAGYRQASTMRSAYDLGYGFDTKTISKEALDALPADARSKAVSAMAQRFSDLIAPQGGVAQSPAQVKAIADRMKAKLSLTFGKDAEGFVNSLLEGSSRIQAGRVASDLAAKGLAGAKPKRLKDILAPVFGGDEKALKDFVASVKAGIEKTKTSKLATAQAERGFSAGNLGKARDKLVTVFGSSEAADDFLATVVDALGRKEGAVAAREIEAAVGRGDVSGLRKTVGAIAGEDVVDSIATPAETAAKRLTSANLSGADTKFVPVGDQASDFAQLAASPISGSWIGAGIRAGLTGNALAIRRIAQSAGRKEADILKRILSEKDPEKIAAILRFVKQDLTGKPYRWPIMYQGPNALQALAREE